MSDLRPFPADSGTEPALAELLSDQTLLLLLRRDGLNIEQLLDVIARWRAERYPDLRPEEPAPVAAE